MKEIDQLVKMANQIASNFSFHEDGVVRVADHLARFWAPVMRRQLREFCRAAVPAWMQWWRRLSSAAQIGRTRPGIGSY
jgi:hypothetical protein